MELFHNIDSDPGPEGPERSDEEIRDNIKTLYQSSPYLRDKNLKVSVKDCVVTLEGEVHSPQSWQLAADLAVDVRGVKELRNHIQIKKGPGSPA